LSLETISAAATVGLLIATAIYAFLTWQLAKSASTTVALAQRAALAAERSAVVAEAALPIRFRVQYMDTPLGRHINIWNNGARVVLHGARLDIWMFFHRGEKQDFDPSELDTLESALPAALHRGEGMTFLAPNHTPIDTKRPFMGHVTVRYSLPSEETVREVGCAVLLVETDEVEAWIREMRNEGSPPPDDPRDEG
jgi:hypothetical protein